MKSVFIHSLDGLKLHARVWRCSPTERQPPVLCLPGLARTSADFIELAEQLCKAGQRQIIAMDYRGRGLSDRDPNTQNYDVRVELEDTLNLLSALGLTQVDLIGTSRGGLIAMAMAVRSPQTLRKVVLNDIGPTIEREGLKRIQSYLSIMSPPQSWAHAIEALKKATNGQFPTASDETWRKYAQRTWHETDHGRLETWYDPKILHALKAFDPDAPLPDLWPYFEALKSKPLLIIRGENSDLLTQETMQTMQQRHTNAHTWTTKDEGHAPLLMDEKTQHVIKTFLD